MTLYQLVETEDSLEVGPVVGELVLAPSGLEICVDDPALRARLASLLEQPLRLRMAAAGTLGTAEIPVRPGDEGFVNALVERLRKPDFRLHVGI